MKTIMLLVTIAVTNFAMPTWADGDVSALKSGVSAVSRCTSQGVRIDDGRILP